MASETLSYFQPGSAPDGQPIPRAELFDSEANDEAKKLTDFDNTQLRRFYSVVSALRNEAKGNPDFPDDLIRARLALLKAHVHYQKGRDRKFPADFVAFIDRHVKATDTRTKFLYGFAPHFEAVVAYHRFLKAQDK